MPADRKPVYSDPTLIENLASRIGALEAAIQPDDGDRTQQYRQGQAVLGGLTWGSGQDTVAKQGSEFVRNSPGDGRDDTERRLQDLQDQIENLQLLIANGAKDLNQSNAGSVSQQKGDNGNTGSDLALPPPGDAGTVLTSNGVLVDPSYQAAASAAQPWVYCSPASTSCVNGATTVIAYTAATGTMSSAVAVATGVFTAPTAGVYLFNLSGYFGNGATAPMDCIAVMQLAPSGGGFSDLSYGTLCAAKIASGLLSTSVPCSISVPLSLSAGDQIRTRVTCSAGVTVLAITPWTITRIA